MYPRILFAIVLLMCCFISKSQRGSKEDAQYKVCISYEVYKGKKNHGQKYCTGEALVNYYKDGRTDTVWWMSGGGQIFLQADYDKYEKLSERGKYIIDSLKEDGITSLQQDYLTYEPMYMKDGRKTERLWTIWGEGVWMYEYLFWHSDKGFGTQLVKKFEVK